MWDPLLHDFPESLHGFRCMLAVKYLLCVSSLYPVQSVGFELLRDCISAVRTRSYDEGSCKYSALCAKVRSTSEGELTQTRTPLCCCPHCPRHIGRDRVETETKEPEP
ncbi:movement protein [Polygala garcinii associated virus]|uniref:Movement protein n=1 Tax=Polygala garcinii associated virus TaxID=2093274 RepID=A0A2I8B2Q1_9GEMI|nr:movement protein [Polygala garcinii associated virus]AUT11869.1 movement protein [Polygala garcinii associated virus]